MMQLKNAFLAAETLRYLRPVQFYWRFYLLYARRRLAPTRCPADIHWRHITLHAPVERPVSVTNNRFTFLNHKEHFNGEIDWNKPGIAKLWLYNLHYFDFLQQPGLAYENGVELIEKWIINNPPFYGNGWESYTLSLRIVNWIKFLSSQNQNKAELALIMTSLYIQARTLRRILEYHLLANHLFKNGVALLFVGKVFCGKEAAEWYTKGKEILTSQIKEQILPDGGHFERSPMYHAITLEDVLDCLNLLIAAKEEDELFIHLLRKTAENMLGFLSDIVHVDGSLPRFNDTAERIASSLDQLIDYAERLGVNKRMEKGSSGFIEKPDFGLYILSKGDWRCVIDAGAIGPDYQPGHTHCDTLSFELTIKGKPFAVNAGTYTYAGPERNLFRSTRSHNTLEIDGKEQHEIWSKFRVARRGYPKNVSIEHENNLIQFKGQHTGYKRLPGRPLHQRKIQLSENGMIVFDQVLSKRNHQARSYIHLHPDVDVRSIDESRVVLSLGELTLLIENDSESDLNVMDYEFSPQFGLKQQAKVIVVKNTENNGVSSNYSIRSI